MTLLSAYRKITARPVSVSLRLIMNRLLTSIEGLVVRNTDRRKNGKCRLCRGILAPARWHLPLNSVVETDNLLQHRFNVLGSGLVTVDYSLAASGVAGQRYPMSLDVGSFDNSGAWLTRILLPAHQLISRDAWREVSSDYVPIDWQQDIKSGYRWSQKVYHKNIPHLPGLVGVDIKVPWELARMQHLPRLALAVRSCSDPAIGRKLAREFRNQVLDFIATNPVDMGVNWTCAMDVAIRGVNLLLAFDLLRGTVADEWLDDHFKDRFSSSIWQHGAFITRNLEVSAPKNNHYLADIAGLFIISLYLEEKEWREFALEELKREIHRQFHADGTNFEASIPYHKFAAEMVLYPVCFALSLGNGGEKRPAREAAEAVFGVEYLRKLYLIIDSFRYLLKPDGTLPQIGDNDSGQFIDLAGRNSLDGRHILALGAALFIEADWKIHEFDDGASEPLTELSVLLGQPGVEIWRRLAATPFAAAGCKGFDASGWYVLRNERIYLLISCMENSGRNLTVHRHNDHLSCELAIDGVNVLVDPGSYLYGPAPLERDRYRGGESHNTVNFIDTDGSVVEQNRFDGLFSIKPGIEVTGLVFNEGSFRAGLEHPQFSCERHFILLENGVNIRNVVSAAAELDWYNNLLFAPGLPGGSVIINTRLLADHATETYHYSPGYGVQIPAARLRLKAAELSITCGEKE